MANHVYLDASALAKRYVIEIGTPLVNHLFQHVPAKRVRGNHRIQRANWDAAILEVRTNSAIPVSRSAVKIDDLQRRQERVQRSMILGRTLALIGSIAQLRQRDS